MAGKEALLRAHDLWFVGAGSYVNQTEKLPLDGQGAVLISGPEGSGKTMILEVPSIVLYGKGSTRIKSSGLTPSTISNEITGFKAGMSFSSGYGTQSQESEILQAYKYGPKKENSYRIHVNGKDITPDDKREQKKLVRKLAPISREEWMGVVYLAQGSTHNLLSGSGTDKKNYLTSVFGLDFFEDLVFVTNTELEALEDQARGAAELEQRRKDLNEEISEVKDRIAACRKLEDVAADLEKTKARQKRLAAKTGEISSKIRAAQSLADLREKIEATGYASKQEAEAELGKLTSKGQKASSFLGEARSDLKSQQSKKENFLRLKARLEKRAKTLSALKSSATKLRSRVKGFPSKAALKEVRQVSSALGDEELRWGTSGPDNWRERKDAAVTALSVSRDLKQLMRSKNRSCPTCHTELTEDGLKASISVQEEQAAEASSQYVLGACTAMERVTPWVTEFSTNEDLQDGISEAFETLSKYSEVKTQYAEQKELVDETKAEFAELEEPEEFTTLEERVAKAERVLKTTAEKLEAVRKVCTLFNRLEGAGDAEDADLDTLTDELSQAERKLEALEVKISDLSAEHTDIVGLSRERKVLTKQLDQTDQKIAAHAETIEKIDLYNKEVIPYLTTLRVAKINGALSVLEGILPVYVNAMSSAQYKGAEVKLEISPDLTSIDLQLRTKAHGPWLSALQNSGGQRQRFTLSMIAAFREASPRAANVMFFDEPFAHLQSHGKMLFVKKLLPTLLERCEDLTSVFVTAHDFEVINASRSTFANHWDVSNDGVSSVITRKEL